MNKTFKAYLISSLVTFLTAFCIVILPHIDSLSLETLKSGAFIGVIGAGVRAGIKALIEYFLSSQANSIEK